MIDVEGVFLIIASKEHVFLNRKHILNEVFGYSGFDSYEHNGGVWKLIATATFDSMDEVKRAMGCMREFQWFLGEDSTLLVDGKEIYSDGVWLDC